MQITNFTNCCNAYILYNFGETELNQVENDRAYGRQIDINVDVDKDMERQLLHNIQYYGDKLLTATTNNEQKTINKLLLKHNFKHTAWMSKRQHPETKLRLWWREPEV
jgi:hypothetical protein